MKIRGNPLTHKMKQKKHEEECECGHDHNISEDKQKEIQNKIMEINLYENKLKQLEQSLNFIDQQIMEQQMIQFNLDELKKSKKGQDMLFPLGKNVFVKGKVEGHEIMINIGGNVVVKKDEEKAKEIIERQKLQLSSLREEIAKEIEKIINHISMIEKSIQM
jgi:prefoldin alpha subunit